MKARRFFKTVSHNPPASAVITGVAIYVVVLLFTGESHPRPAIVFSVLAGLSAWLLGWFLRRSSEASDIVDPHSEPEATEDVLQRLKFFKLDTGALRLAFAKGVSKPAAAIADFILERAEIKTNVLMGYEQHGARKWGRRIFCFALPQPLLHALALQSAEIRWEVERRLMDGAKRQLVTHAQGQSGEEREDEDNVRILADKALAFEVLIRDDLPADLIYWRCKTVLSGSAPITHLLVDNRQDAHQGGGIFRSWEDASGSGLDVERGQLLRTPRLFAYQDLTLFCLPEGFDSRLADIALDRRSEEIEVARFSSRDGRADALKKSLNIRVTPFTPALSTAHLRHVGRKGSIRVVGFSLNGQVQTFREDQFRQELRTATTLVFSSEPTEVPEGSPGRDVTGLLNPIFERHAELRRIVYAQGNFFIEYLPIAAGASYAQYQLKPLRGTTLYFNWQPDRGPEAWRDLANYRPFAVGTFTKVPSNCYVLTFSGSGEDWVCLHIDIGSPGVAETDFGSKGRFAAIDDTTDLRLTLELFARREHIADYELTPKSAQGLLAKGLAPDGRRVFLKMPDPTHVNYNSTGEIFELLQRHQLVPPSAKVAIIDDFARRAPDGKLLVFITTHYLTAGEAVDDPAYSPFPARIALCSAMAEFAARLLNIGIVCPDWGLAETAIVDPNDENGWGGSIFVVDYGSYMLADLLSRERHNRKPECEGPENWDASLPFHAEPYMVFGLGLLFLSALTRSPGLLPAALQERDPEAYARGIKKQIEIALREASAAAAASLLTKMLAWNPSERTPLSQVLETLRRLHQS